MKKKPTPKPYEPKEGERHFVVYYIEYGRHSYKGVCFKTYEEALSHISERLRSPQQIYYEYSVEERIPYSRFSIDLTKLAIKEKVYGK
jgi:hypothetical protein